MSKTLSLQLPPHSVRYFGEGEHCSDPQPADWLLVDHGTGISRGIKLGQSIIATITQRSLRGFTWLDHSALLVPLRGGAMQVSEMGPSGHELRPLSDYHDRRYAVVHFDVSDEARQGVLDFDRAMWGADYGWIQYLALALNGVAATHFDLSYGDAIICSTHVTLASSRMGFFPDRLAQSVMPTHLAAYVGASFPNNTP